MLVAIIPFCVKEAIVFFKKKDKAEDELTNDLIGDLRKERKTDLINMSQVLLKIDASQQQIATAVQEMSKAVQDLNASTQQNARIHADILAGMREQERILFRLEAYLASSEKK